MNYRGFEISTTAAQSVLRNHAGATTYAYVIHKDGVEEKRSEPVFPSESAAIKQAKQFIDAIIPLLQNGD